MSGDDAAAAAAGVLWPAGPMAAAPADLAWLLIIGGTCVFAVTMLLVAFSLRRHSAPVPSLRWIVGGGLLFPVLVLTPLWGYSVWRSAELLAPPPPGTLIVSVSARMWWWEVRYRDPASGREAVLANELRIPVGRPVRLGLTTDDVIHSFWVPALAGKADMLPGRVTHLQLAASQPGIYRGQCAEYCGDQHAQMALHVVAEPPEVFDAWLARQASDAAAPTGALQVRGRVAFVAQRCDACHAVRGLTAPGGAAGLAPDLTHVGGRLFLGAGRLANDGDAMQQWLAQVQVLKPGARMPSFAHLDADTLAALGAYLRELQ